MEPFTTYEKHNNFSLAFSDYQGNSFDNEKAIGKRFVLLLIEDGSGIASINEQAVPYIAPCVFCLNETEHCTIPETDNSKVKAIFFHPCIINSFLNFDNIRNLGGNLPMTLYQDREMLKFFLNRENLYKGKFNLGPLAGKKYSVLYDELHNQITNQNVENWPCRSRSYIMELLFLLENLYKADLFVNEADINVLQEDFYPILLYVYHNYNKKISVNDILKEFHISRTTFAQMFQKNVGDSFLSFLNKLRISIAATMLRDTLLPVNEIMFRVGFTDQVHFLRTFKKITNMTPSAYREKYNWM